MKSISSLTLLASIFLQAIAYGQAGSSCRSIEGFWVDHAKSETAKLKSALQILEKDQNNSCRTFVDVASSLVKTLESGDFSPQAKEILKQPKQVKDNRDMGQFTESTKQQEAMAQTTLEAQKSSIANLATGKEDHEKNGLFLKARQYISTNASGIAEFASKINTPEVKDCLENANYAGQVAKMIGTAANLLSTFNQTGIGEVSAVAEAAGAVARSLQNKNIEKAMSNLGAVGFLNQLSCVVESTVANFCEVNDAKDFFDQQTHSASLIAQLNKKYENINTQSFNPLDSYYILHRDLPNIVAWIIKTKMVNVPYSEAEASTQNGYKQIVLDFQTRLNSVRALYQTKKRELYSESCGDICKKKGLAALVVLITANVMGKAVEQDGFKVNFFTGDYTSDNLPFTLIGREVPPAVTGQFGDDGIWTDPDTGLKYNAENTQMMDAGVFLRSAGRNAQPHPFLNEPLRVLDLVADNMENIFDTAQKKATQFELEYLVGDKINLVSRLASAPNISVQTSFNNVIAYLNKLKSLFSNKLTEGGAGHIAEKIIAQVKTRDLDLVDPEADLIEEEDEELEQNQYTYAISLRDVVELLERVTPIAKIINKYAVNLSIDAEKVLFEINNKLSTSVNGANFLPNRIETLAQAELRMSLREQQGYFRGNIKEWLLVSDQTFYSFMAPTVADTSTSATTKNSQLKSALTYANANISSLELSYKEWLFAFIVALREKDGTVEINGRDKSVSGPISSSYSPAAKAQGAVQTAELDLEQAKRDLKTAELAYGNSVFSKASAASIEQNRQALHKASAKVKAAENDLKIAKNLNGLYIAPTNSENNSVEAVVANGLNAINQVLFAPLSSMFALNNLAAEKVSFTWNSLAGDAKVIKLDNLKEYVDHGSLKFWADRLCIQSLAFIDTPEEMKRFDLYCANAHLESLDVESLKNAGLISAEALQSKKLEVSYRSLSRSTNAKDKICSLRDYYRSNDALHRMNTLIGEDLD